MYLVDAQILLLGVMVPSDWSHIFCVILAKDMIYERKLDQAQEHIEVGTCCIM